MSNQSLRSHPQQQQPPPQLPQPQPQLQQQQTSQITRYNNNQYDKIRVLGKGSFGTAIVHRRKLDCSLVVLKEIDLQRFRGEKERSLAINEARIMSTLSHPNIIKYYNAYTTETKLIIEMEYASIGTLASYLSLLGQSLDEREILVIFRQIAAGLSYLHSMNIIHLDLKMTNIFVTIDGLVKIGDFGISQFIVTTGEAEARTPSESPSNGGRRHATEKRTANRVFYNSTTSSHLGTLAYSSPERCLGQPTDFKSDIWSLGCILYELITSKLLFDGDCLPVVILSITRVHYQPIKRKISPILRDTFERMIARDPGERPSASELLSVCDRLLSHPQMNRQQRLVKRQNFDLSTEAPWLAAQNLNDVSQINYPHSLVYQVRLDSQNIHVDRVNLPQTKRIKGMSKGKSHYLVLTYDNIVYGWGSKTHGQLGACNLTHLTSASSAGSKSRVTRSARSSVNAKDSQSQFMSDFVPLSTPNSPASSTQTIVSSSSHFNSFSQTNLTRATNQQLTRQLVSSMLKESQPASRPFVINELNHRKIIQVAAGNNFSVFLSKTGIVMTCGDQSTGCLGRGDTMSCFTPCMVDSLLNMDVTRIACGPKHVVAVCGNGRAFGWGKSSYGRLGVSGEKSGIDPTANLPVYVTRPKLVHFPAEVFVKDVFCGDRSTIFVDANGTCWACGDNKFNKLGLDIKRRFKKTIIVDRSWTPTEVTALGKYKIVNCSIGENHSTFVSNEGKLVVFGQDIDHNYRLQRNIIDTRRSHRRISSELQTKRRSRPRASGTHPSSADQLMRLDQPAPSVDYKRLAQSLILNNQLSKFKLSKQNLMEYQRHNQIAENYRLDESQRQQVDSYMKKSRAMRRMPFECVIGASCTSNFTLALTNDNKIYFWGTRSYENGSSSQAIASRHRRKTSVEPQLVASCSDECFIKIGPTNNSLMSSIQTLGSDQPIIHAQDPRLVAGSLADLWILDYRPTTGSAGSSSSSSSRSSLGSSSSSCSCCCCCCCCGDDCSELSAPELRHNQSPGSIADTLSVDDDDGDTLRHDAILEPQSIVSLYVPSMFNYNGCSLHLVDLFCFDEDRFYLVLDTTVKLQQPQAQQQQQQQPQQPQQQPQQQQQQQQQQPISSQRTSRPQAWQQTAGTNVGQPQTTPKSKRLFPLVEATNEQLSRLETNREPSRQPSELICNANISDAGAPARGAGDKQEPCCSMLLREERRELEQSQGDKVSLIEDTDDEMNNNIAAAHNVGQASSGGGVSLEEPRSFSTFGAALDNHIVVGPSMQTSADMMGSRSLRVLNFQEEANGDERAEQLDLCPNLPSSGRLLANKSESTNESTYHDIEETSSMPSWVRNEFMQYQRPAAGRAGAWNGAHDESEVEDTCTSEISLSSESSLTMAGRSLECGAGSSRSIDSNHDDDDDESTTQAYEVARCASSESSGRISSPGTPNDDCLAGDAARTGEPGPPDVTAPASGSARQAGRRRTADGSREELGPLQQPGGALSRSQPNMSEHYLVDTECGARGRCASILGSTGRASVGNLLDCSVYKSQVGNSGDTCNISVGPGAANNYLLSGLSSRSTSTNPLIGPVAAAASDRRHLASNSMGALVGRPPDEPAARHAEALGAGGCSRRPNRLEASAVSGSYASHSPARGQNLSNSVQFVKASKLSSSLSSLRRSLARLFC